MNNILRKPINRLGYDFIAEKHLPEGKDEYYIRNRQNKKLFGEKKEYRHLTAGEIETLVQNDNTSEDWNKLWVTDAFNPDLVKRCSFYGLVRISKLEPFYLEFKSVRMSVGLYDSTIVSCDFGDNVVVDHVNFIGHHIIGDESILMNINELSTSPHAKFGQGILKSDEEEDKRIWIELCNENGGRQVLPFEGMLPGDAFLWSKYRGDEKLMTKLLQLTEQEFDTAPGYYGKIGHHCVIKNSKSIKDVQIGDEVYIKGVNKLKNLTIRSNAESSTQIGEGCELVNGIIGYGCRIFYGVKAVRFILADYSNLKYGARLLNSFLGSNATISCCEVLNSLIFPSHEQHHNNSFLCSALVMGQSNMAAGATIGSNHNSRRPDGELVAGRGFWPGLCVSLKHNSKLASFTLLSKGDYPAEINLPLPFSLLVNDMSKDKLLIMPGYWFLYNMYALTRNSWKYPNRDKRVQRIQYLETDYLAPDSVEEMFTALQLIETATGHAVSKNLKLNDLQSQKKNQELGKEYLLEHPQKLAPLAITMDTIENAKRPTELIKVAEGYAAIREMIFYYGIQRIVKGFENELWTRFSELKEKSLSIKKHSWVNIGGQIIRQSDMDQMTTDIKNQKINSWEEVHHQYQILGQQYLTQKYEDGLAALLLIKETAPQDFSAQDLSQWLEEGKEISHKIQKNVEQSREKDYRNPFRTMVYDNQDEMDNVIGSQEKDPFIEHTRWASNKFLNNISAIQEVLDTE